jgi:hypothetical protein
MSPLAVLTTKVMKSKTIVWCSVLIVIALWFGYAMGYRNGVHAERKELLSWIIGPNGLRSKYVTPPTPMKIKNAVRSDFTASEPRLVSNAPADK